MTIENSEDTAQVSVPDPAPAQGIEPASTESSPPEPVREGPAHAETASSPAIEVGRNSSAHDSAPPQSRKLAPPPKPKRDSGMASSPASGMPGEGSDPLTSSISLKAPNAPTFAHSADDTAKMQAFGVRSSSSSFAPPAPLSQPPPISRGRSNPALAAEASEGNEGVARSPSEPSLPSKAESAPQRPLTARPRPRSEPPPASTAPASVPPSPSAIFAMRIIAVGDSVRPPVVQESTPDLDKDSYPPSASRLGTSVRRSSRPSIALVNAPVEAPVEAPIEVPVEVPVSEPEHVAAPEPALVVEVSSPPANLLAALEEDIPIEVDAPVASEPAPPLVELRPPPPPPPVELGAVPPEELRQVLGDVDGSRDSVSGSAPDEKTAATSEAEELGREDAISLPPEELAALKAELDAKAEVKPPPPPKRTTGATGMAPGAAPSSAPSAEGASKEPPTPDPAAAKAAQRAKTRQPWWEDLFNEDFMRASSRVSDDQIRKEVTFIEESLGVAAGGVVLDLGCGAGHHAVEFASRGYGVVGYDLSLYQLALAADVAQERSQKINFLQGDMREMAFDEMFDGVFCWNTTFGYFEEDKNLAVAQRVFKALRPGGMFLIDVLNRDYAAASAPCSVWYEGDSCVCMDDMSVDYISSRLRVKRSIILDDGRTKESLYSLRLYSLHELGKLLHEVGFRVTEASGHPSTPGVFFGPNSPRIIMLAQRP
ncbi:MAG: methyltransferase domain-containing protein [Polyangiaceae bacterium]